MSDDEKQLSLLSIFHFVMAGLTALFACIPGIYVVLGALMVTGSLDQMFRDQKGGPPPEIIGWIFIIIGAVIILIGWICAFCLFWAGRCLQKRRGYLFCMVMAALSCLNMPFGTILGVFTLVVLMRPSVHELFEQRDITEMKFDSPQASES